MSFKHNLAVDPAEVKGFKAIIKDFINGNIVDQVEKLINNDNDIDVIKNGLINFGKDKNFNLVPGNFYKFQLCYLYLSDEQLIESPYSYITIGRYLGSGQDETERIKVNINILGDSGNHKFQGSDLIDNGKLGEKIYQYRFDLMDSAKNILQTSNWQIYTNIIPSFTVYYNYTSKQYYTISYSIKTYNGYETTATKEFQASGITSTDNFNLIATQDDPKALENGYINIEVSNHNQTGNLNNHEILRKTITDDYWEKIYTFGDNTSANEIIRDNTVVHGIPYEYVCCSPDGRLIAPSSITIPIIAKFDHMFLSDKERQLCIRFNPKVSSYKQTILEQKIDTIDGKYPIILRNGAVNYKEIAISGLISFYMDNDYFFWNKENIIDNSIFTTDLSHENFTRERKFRDEVIEWLNNGEPKLFRSPAEGNIIIRLMNVSIAPNEQLGRMLYTFSATGYEVEDTKNEIEKYITKSLQI